MKPTSDLIKKFLNNQCTNTEARAVRQYFEENAAEMEMYMPLNDWLVNDEKSLNEAVSDRMLHNIHEIYNNKKQVSIRKRLVRYSVAASLTGLVVLAGLTLFTGKPTIEQTLTAIDPDNIQALKRVENVSEFTMEVKLPDSSVVTLYPHSSLQYLPAFTSNKRDVYLQGEALFTVKRDTLKPFTVYEDSVATTALGTVFSVSETGYRKVSVKLINGSAKVWPQYGNADKSVIMRQGDEVIVNGDHFTDYVLNGSSIKNRTSAEVKQHMAYKREKQLHNKENKVAFKNASLKEVFKKVKERFGVTICYKLATNIEDKLFTGTFLKKDSLEFICKTICTLHGLQYRIDGNTVTISHNN
jgi:transmembrane sensor